MLYIARIKLAKANRKVGRALRKIRGCSSLEEAWDKAIWMFPEDKVVSVQLSKRKLNAMSD